MKKTWLDNFTKLVLSHHLARNDTTAYVFEKTAFIQVRLSGCMEATMRLIEHFDEMMIN